MAAIEGEPGCWGSWGDAGLERAKDIMGLIIKSDLRTKQALHFPSPVEGSETATT